MRMSRVRAVRARRWDIRFPTRAQVLRDPEELWLGVAHVGAPEATPPVLLHYRLTHQPVLDAAGMRKSADSPTRLRSAP